MESKVGVYLGFEFLLVIKDGREGWMDTGGARAGMFLVTDGGDMADDALGEPLHAESSAGAGKVLVDGVGRWEERCSCGLAEEPWRPWIVDVLEVGEAAWEAKFSTSSIECDCQPLLTLTMA